MHGSNLDLASGYLKLFMDFFSYPGKCQDITSNLARTISFNILSYHSFAKNSGLHMSVIKKLHTNNNEAFKKKTEMVTHM
jgi:hypothetical protein